MDYNPDDMVDVWRRASCKEISSWRGTPGQPADIVISFHTYMSAGKFENYGMINASNSHEVTAATRGHHDVALALSNVTQIHFGIDVAEAIWSDLDIK